MLVLITFSNAFAPNEETFFILSCLNRKVFCNFVDL